MEDQEQRLGVFANSEILKAKHETEADFRNQFFDLNRKLDNTCLTIKDEIEGDLGSTLMELRHNEDLLRDESKKLQRQFADMVQAQKDEETQRVKMLRT